MVEIYFINWSVVISKLQLKCWFPSPSYHDSKRQEWQTCPVQNPLTNNSIALRNFQSSLSTFTFVFNLFANTVKIPSILVCIYLRVTGNNGCRDDIICIIGPLMANYSPPPSVMSRPSPRPYYLRCTSTTYYPLTSSIPITKLQLTNNRKNPMKYQKLY